MLLKTQLQTYLEANPYVKTEIENCDSEIFKNGKSLIILDGSGYKDEIEMIVKTISNITSVPLDWHYSGGRVQVFYLGNETEYSIATNCFKRNMVWKLKISLTSLDILSQSLFKLCFIESHIYGFSYIECPYSNYNTSIEVFVDQIQLESIEFMLKYLVDNNQLIIEKEACWLPSKNVSLLKFVEFGGYGLYRAAVA